MQEYIHSVVLEADPGSVSELARTQRKVIECSIQEGKRNNNILPYLLLRPPFYFFLLRLIGYAVFGTTFNLVLCVELPYFGTLKDESL